MVLTAFLSAITEAYTKGEFNWIKATMKRINYIWIISSIGTIVLIFGYRLFFKIWIDNQIHIPVLLIISLGILSIINTFSSTFTLFLNGVGKIRLQIYINVIQAISFFPLSYLFYKLNFGLPSLVIPNIIFFISGSIIFYIQYSKIINQKANGIWIK